MAEKMREMIYADGKGSLVRMSSICPHLLTVRKITRPKPTVASPIHWQFDSDRRRNLTGGPGSSSHTMTRFTWTAGKHRSTAADWWRIARRAASRLALLCLCMNLTLFASKYRQTGLAVSSRCNTSGAPLQQPQRGRSVGG